MKIIVMSAVVTFKISSMQIIAWMFSGADRALGRRLDAVSVQDLLESDSLNQSFFSLFYPFLLPWGVGINLPFFSLFWGLEMGFFCLRGFFVCILRARLGMSKK